MATTRRTPIRRSLFWRSGVQSAVRLGDWKLVRDDRTGQTELFDLGLDLGEAKDLAAANPSKVEQLVAAHLGADGDGA